MGEEFNMATLSATLKESDASASCLASLALPAFAAERRAPRF